MLKKKIICMVGTRPEVIKMAPVILRLKIEKGLEVKVVASGQHRDLSDQMLHLFHITPDKDLDLMEINQSLPALTSHILVPLDRIFQEEKPSLIISQGDTTTAFTSSLAAFYHKIPFAHVEAGLRTQNAYNPFPEEMNRTLMGRLATLHLAPTSLARDNLLREGLAPSAIHVTGNTVIDAMQWILKQERTLDKRIDLKKRLLLVTAHRRENFGPNLENICRALLAIANLYEDVQIFYSVHPNPSVQGPVYQYLKNHPHIILSDPLSYESFLRLMKEAYLILSDSGGVQEEAPLFGTPLLILRDSTERMEGCFAGSSKIVGTDTTTIIASVQELLDDSQAYQAMKMTSSPFGDGKASERIAEITMEFLEGEGKKAPQRSPCSFRKQRD